MTHGKPLFAETAIKLWAVAATVLHWPPDTFWSATPAELTGAFPMDGNGGPSAIAREDIERMLKGLNHG